MEGGEPPGIWHGRGAQKLGLEDTVSKRTLRRLFKGEGPDGQPLVQLQRGRNRQPGWDLTFSAPKSVSTFWSQAGPELRRELQKAHLRSLRTALDYLEQNAAFSRRGHAGQGRTDPCSLIIALFEHGTSRAQEPDLHTHCLVINAAFRDDGTTGTVRSRDFYLHKMAAGALYRTQMAYECSQLGLEIRRGKYSFELAGVPEELNDRFSTRSHEINEAIAREGFTGPTAKALAALTTRQLKGHVARNELFSNWSETGRKFKFTRKDAD